MAPVSPTIAPPTVPSAAPAAAPVAPGAALADPASLGVIFSQMARNFIKVFPKMSVRLGISLGVVLVLNVIFMSIPISRLPYALAQLVGVITWVFAIYTSILAKIVFWTIIFTVGRSLVLRIKREGFGKVEAELWSIGPSLKRAWATLADKAPWVLMAGAGLGLMTANFMSKYNMTNKYGAAVLVFLAIAYALGEGTRSQLFVFLRVGSKDVGRLFGKPAGFSNGTIFLGAAGALAGIVVDFPLLYVPFNYTGYVLGAVVVIAAVVLSLTVSKPKAVAG